MRLLLRDARFLRPAIVMGTSVGGLYTLATILPFVLIDSVGLSPTQFGVGMMVQSGSFILGSFVMRRLLRSVEAHRMVPVGLGFICVGALLLPLMLALAEPSFLAVMGPIGVLAFGIPFVMPTMMTESLAPFPRIAGAASALSGFFQMGGGLIGSGDRGGDGRPVAGAGDDPSGDGVDRADGSTDPEGRHVAHGGSGRRPAHQAGKPG